MTDPTGNALRARAEPPVQSEAEGLTFQARVDPWLIACFGEEIARDREERNHRFLEEALELVQSCGCTASEAHQLVDYVYGRPMGIPIQEIGGVMVTLAALCLAHKLDMHEAGEIELARIWTKVEKIRAKQAAKPKYSPLPEAAEAKLAATPPNASAAEVTEALRDLLPSPLCGEAWNLGPDERVSISITFGKLARARAALAKADAGGRPLTEEADHALRYIRTCIDGDPDKLRIGADQLEAAFRAGGRPGPVAGEVTDDLLARFREAADKLEAADTLPEFGGLYYAIKKDGEEAGWRYWQYVSSGLLSSDVRAAATALASRQTPKPDVGSNGPQYVVPTTREQAIDNMRRDGDADPEGTARMNYPHLFLDDAGSSGEVDAGPDFEQSVVCPACRWQGGRHRKRLLRPCPKCDGPVVKGTRASLADRPAPPQQSKQDGSAS